MKKIKSIRINYIEDNKGKTQVYKLDKLPEDKKNLILDFCEEPAEQKEVIFISRIFEPESFIFLPLRSILIIGPTKGADVHFSEKIYKEFKKKDYIIEYLSPSDLEDPNQEYVKKFKLFPLSKILNQSKISPELIFIEECEFWWDNDVNIPVFYKHREFKRPPTVYHPDVVFFENEDIITYFEKMFAPHWMSNVKHKIVLYPAVDPEQYQPQKKKYKGINVLGFREDITNGKVYNFPELANIADMKLILQEFEELKKNKGIRYFDTPITNEDYRRIMPQCEVMFVHVSTKQYISRTMLECMACMTGCALNLENQRHKYILEQMGYNEGIHYLGLNMPSGDLDYAHMSARAYQITLKNHTYEKRMNFIVDLYKRLNFKSKRYDVICPVYWTNNHFKDNVQNWFKEIPINILYLGINNPKVKIKINDPRIKIIDQTHLKTLGACLADLMKRIETRWFVFIHSDAHINANSFIQMESFINEKVGIIESERVHWKDDLMKANDEMIPYYMYDNYKERARSFSGFQLMRKHAIQSLIDKIEDDYIYANEDYLFQYESFKNGFEYKKTWAMHIHQNKKVKRTVNDNRLYDMQFKGLIKYSNPTPITKQACLAALKWCKGFNELKLMDVIVFCQMYNPNWSVIICEEWDKW